MVNACADPDFFVTEGGGGGGGGGGVQAQRRENSFDFFYVCFGFFSPKFSGDAGRGPTIYERVQMLISIELVKTCDLPGMGSGPPTPPPPPPSGSAHA